MVTSCGTDGITLSKAEFAHNQLPPGSYKGEPAEYFVAADKFITFQARIQEPCQASVLEATLINTNNTRLYAILTVQASFATPVQPLPPITFL